MALLKIICWALICNIRIRFPPGHGKLWLRYWIPLEIEFKSRVDMASDSNRYTAQRYHPWAVAQLSTREKKQKRGEFKTPPRPTGRRSNNWEKPLRLTYCIPNIICQNACRFLIVFGMNDIKLFIFISKTVTLWIVSTVWQIASFDIISNMQWKYRANPFYSTS